MRDGKAEPVCPRPSLSRAHLLSKRSVSASPVAEVCLGPWVAQAALRSGSPSCIRYVTFECWAAWSIQGSPDRNIMFENANQPGDCFRKRLCVPEESQQTFMERNKHTNSALSFLWDVNAATRGTEASAWDSVQQVSL